jgi:hypothetical protein
MDGLRGKWRGQTTLKKVLWSILAFVVVMTVIGAAAGGSSKKSNSVTNAALAQTTPEAPAVPVRLHLNEGNYSVWTTEAAISGTVTSGASVTVNGQPVPVHGGRWREPLRLHIGDNSIAVVATMDGRAPAESTIQVIRHHSTAELEAKAAARAQKEREGAETSARIQRLKEESQKEETSPGEAEEETTPGGESSEGECPNGTYENSNGNTICDPYTPENGERPAGATAECEDGTYSFSEHHSGTCSGHGGVKEWLE